MKGRSIWFLCGVLAAPLVLTGYSVFVKRFPAVHEAIIFCLLLGTIAALPSFLARAKKDAVPAKRSDWIGYAVIALFCLMLFMIARAVIT